MQRAAASLPSTQFLQGAVSAWQARRWYYSGKRRAYSVRAIAPGDRRLLAEFSLGLAREATGRERTEIQDFTAMLFNRGIVAGGRNAAGFAALETTSAGDRVIGACAHAPAADGGADFCIAVAHDCRAEQIGRTLLATLLRHARRAGVTQLSGEMHWANRPMHLLAASMGFVIEPAAGGRVTRRLLLPLK